MTAYDPTAIERLIAEAREDGARMLGGKWSTVGSGSILEIESSELHPDGDNIGVAEDLRSEDALGIARTRNNLAAMADQLEAAHAEVTHLKRRDLFRRDCEWFIATDPQPWRIGQLDFPRCANRANCVGETLPRRSQYILCREHAEQWDGDLVAMSGEPVAIPKHLRKAPAAARDATELRIAAQLGLSATETQGEIAEAVEAGVAERNAAQTYIAELQHLAKAVIDGTPGCATSSAPKDG